MALERGTVASETDRTEDLILSNFRRSEFKLDSYVWPVASALVGIEQDQETPQAVVMVGKPSGTRGQKRF